MPAAAELPLKGSATTVGLAAQADGGLFVAVPSARGTTFASLDAKGGFRAGWPLLLARSSGCRIHADPGDGSMRAVCRRDGTSMITAYAFDAAGRLLNGWPVQLPGKGLSSWLSEPTRLIDGDLYVVFLGTEPATATLLRVARDGSLRVGAMVEGVAGSRTTIGPDGTAHVLDSGDESTITAITLDGTMPGYPVRLDGLASLPAFAPDGRWFATVEEAAAGDAVTDGTARVFAFTTAGRPLDGWPAQVPIDTWTRVGDGGAVVDPPVVTRDGWIYVVAGSQRGSGETPGTIAYVFGPDGGERAGSPYESADELVARWGGGVTTIECGPSMTASSPPIGGPEGTLFLAVRSSGSKAGGGDRIVSVGASGKVNAGWPVTLAEKGAWFETFEVGDAGTLFGYALEPAGTTSNPCGKATTYSGTILALDGHGDAIYTTTITVP